MARDVLIAMEKDPHRVAAFPRWGRLWHVLLWATIGYGYMPKRAGLGCLGFVFVGTLLFRQSFRRGRFATMTKDGPPAFHPFIYALDSFVPIVDLHQVRFYLPTSTGLRWYLWAHTAVGWLLTTLLIVGATGIIRTQ